MTPVLVLFPLLFKGTEMPADSRTRWTAAITWLSTSAQGIAPAACGERRPDARALTGRVVDGELRVHREAEVEHREQEQEEERHEEGELDEPLAAGPLPRASATGEPRPATHRIGSMRIALPVLIDMPAPPHRGCPPPTRAMALPSGVTKW